MKSFFRKKLSRGGEKPPLVFMSLADLSLYDLRKGDLRAVPFAALMGLAFVKKATGHLEIKRSKSEKILYFLQGMPVHCRSNIPGESLSELLFKSGAVDRQRLEEVSRVMREEGLPEDQALLKLKIIDESTRYGELQALVTRRILSCFQWGDGRYRFTVEENFLEDVDLFDLSPMDLIHEGISTYSTINFAEELSTVADKEISVAGDLSELESFFAKYFPLVDVNPLKNGALKMFQTVPLICRDVAKSTAFLYELIISGYLAVDGHLPGDEAPPLDEVSEEEEDVPEIAGGAGEKIDSTIYRSRAPVREEVIPTAKKEAASSPLGQSQTKPMPAPPVPPPRFRKKELKPYDAQNDMKAEIARRAQALKTQQRVVDPDLLRRFEKMAEIVRKGDYFEMLGVTIETSRAEIKKAFFEKNRQYHIERARPLGPAGEALSAEITAALDEAHKTLTSPQRRFEYEISLFKKEQELAWNMKLKHELAVKQFRRGHWYLSNKVPQLAFPFFDSTIKLDADKAVYYAFLGWSQYASDRSKIEEARAYLKTALNINPRQSEAMLFLGWIEKDVGNKDAAVTYFEKCLQVDPANKWAKQELDNLGYSSKPKSEGLFGKLFKKK